jgi:hypothetical protein
VAFTPLGHPADQARPKRRRDLVDLVHFERWARGPGAQAAGDGGGGA